MLFTGIIFYLIAGRFLTLWPQKFGINRAVLVSFGHYYRFYLFPLACLEIDWDLENRNSTIQYDDKTTKFQDVLYNWRTCVTNYSDSIMDDNATTICTQCQKSYETLFEFYWTIYTDPTTDFCVDVETTMNDTMHIWHKVWQCPDDSKKDRRHDVLMLLVSVTALVVVLTLFYGGSYVQTERAQRNLIRCKFFYFRFKLILII